MSASNKLDQVHAESMAVHDSYNVALMSGEYTILASQSVTMGSKTEQQPTPWLEQNFTVQAPEFTLDPSLIHSVYPPPGGSGIYEMSLPSITLLDPAFPWVRYIQPNSEAGSIIPWVALLVFAEGELPLVGSSGSPVSTTTVADLIAANPDVVKPVFPSGWLTPEMQASQCQTITIPGRVFIATVPSTMDMEYLTHCRTMSLAGGGNSASSVVLSNRLPVVKGSSVKYYAHLVSLEGLANVVESPKAAIHYKPSHLNELQDVQVVSLYSWTFRSQPELDGGFEHLVKGLIQSEAATGGKLQLPASKPGSRNPNDGSGAVAMRLNNGYVALKYATGTGEDTFCWYRGPLTPVKAQPLPDTCGGPTIAARTGDQLAIYSQHEGLFDTSYSVAWTLGRGLALADANFSAALNKYRVAALNALCAISERRARGKSGDPSVLVSRTFMRDDFNRQMGAGLGQRWTAAVAASGARALSEGDALRLRRAGGRSSFAARTGSTRGLVSLENANNVAAIAAAIESLREPVSAFVGRLAQLAQVPFSHLVADPRMLPVESIRFFYVDGNWIDALIAGALSVAVHTGLDDTLMQKLVPYLTVDAVRPVCGVVARSQIFSDFPGMTVTASAAGADIPLLRRYQRSSTVQLYLYSEFPDTVTINSPFLGLNFGMEQNGVNLRSVAPGTYGQYRNAWFPSGGYPGLLASYSRKASNGVLNIFALAEALAGAVNCSTSEFGSSDFAMQMIQTPQAQSFKIATD